MAAHSTRWQLNASESWRLPSFAPTTIYSQPRAAWPRQVHGSRRHPARGHRSESRRSISEDPEKAFSTRAGSRRHRSQLPSRYNSVPDGHLGRTSRGNYVLDEEPQRMAGAAGIRACLGSTATLRGLVDVTVCRHCSDRYAAIAADERSWRGENGMIHIVPKATVYDGGWRVGFLRTWAGWL